MAKGAHTRKGSSWVWPGIEISLCRRLGRSLQVFVCGRGIMVPSIVWYSQGKTQRPIDNHKSQSGRRSNRKNDGEKRRHTWSERHDVAHARGDRGRSLLTEKLIRIMNGSSHWVASGQVDDTTKHRRIRKKTFFASSGKRTQHFSSMGFLFISCTTKPNERTRGAAGNSSDIS